MYANLLVFASDGDPVVAHEVLIRGPHDVEIHLDDPENEGSFPVPVGVITVDPDDVECIRIVPNF